MVRTTRGVRAGLLSLTTLMGLMTIGQAQTVTHRRNIFHRHPTATAIGAGMVAHHLAKRHGHGLMHRHPVATGLAAAAIAHHYAKKR
jgi:hypothetical protein